MRNAEQNVTDADLDVIEAWRAQLLITARERPWLFRWLLKQGEQVMYRFAAWYTRLRAYARASRGKVRCRLSRAAVMAALLMALTGPPKVLAAEGINVDAGEVVIRENGKCSLREAIINANEADQIYDDCESGVRGVSELFLAPNSTFLIEDLYVDEAYDGDTENGLPPIASRIVIHGNGATLERSRSSDTPPFRLLQVVESGDLTLNEATIIGGEVEGYGGGILNSYGDLTLNDCVITGNRAEGHGGGVASYYGDTAINRCVISDNQAYLGAGVLVTEGDLVLRDSVLVDNRAEGAGGGVMSMYAGKLTIAGCTIAGNLADGVGGGGLAIVSEAEIVNSTISGNIADQLGGGILLAPYGGSIVLSNCTITGNEAKHGGGIGIYGGGDEYELDLTLNRTIVSGNRADEGREAAVYMYDDEGDVGNWDVSNYNLFGYDDDAGLEGVRAGTRDIVPARGVMLEDILGALADNGGPGETHALAEDGPAIDAAPSKDCESRPINGVDQRGVARNQVPFTFGEPTENGCDIGAYEVETTALALPSWLSLPLLLALGGALLCGTLVTGVLAIILFARSRSSPASR